MTLIYISVQAYNRINEKRSSIGSNAIAVVKEHISTLKGKQAAKDWLRWSRRVDGPLFFQAPSPIDSPIDRNDPDYQVSLCRLDLVKLLTNVVSWGPLAVSSHYQPCHPSPWSQRWFGLRQRISKGTSVIDHGGGKDRPSNDIFLTDAFILA